MLSYVFGEDGLRPMKAADIDGTAFLAAVDAGQRRSTLRAYGAGSDYTAWATWADVEERFPGVPWKVLRAKAARLIRRGLMDGCTCGCRGDLEMTPAGHAELAQHATTA